MTAAGSGIRNASGPTTLKNTIVANGPSSGGNCSGTITDDGYNLDSGTSCGFQGTDPTKHSLFTTDPLLDTNGLQDNGGPTKTIALQPNSPAIDAIPDTNGSTNPGCDEAGVTTDQRGVERPQGPACDIGAYEVEDNTAPDAKVDDATTDEDTPVSVNVLSNDTDPDTGDDLDIASFGQGQNGSVACDSETGECTYTPDDDFNGEDSFSYTASDGNGGEDTATVSITVTPVNDAPEVFVAAGGSCGTNDRSGTINLTVTTWTARREPDA